MTLRYFRSFNTGSFATGTYQEVTWTPTEDVHIRHLFISERTGITLDNTQVYIKVPGWIYTDDFVPAVVLGHGKPYVLDLDIEVKAGAEIYVKITNNEGESINVDVVFEVVEKPAGE